MQVAVTSYRRYALVRIVASLTIVVFAVVLTYVCFHVFELYSPRNLDQEQLQQLHRYRHESFGDFLWQFIGHGSLGYDFLFKQDVTNQTFREASVTLSLVFAASAIGLLIGVPLGFLWTRRPRHVRFFAKSYVHVALALWAPWIGIVLSYWLGYRWNVLPIAGYCNFSGAPPGPYECGGPVDWVYHLIMPGFVLGLPLTAYYAVTTRKLLRAVSVAAAGSTAQIDEKMRVARRWATVTFWKLFVRNTCWLIGGTVFVESIFNLHGLGQAIITAYNQGDGPAMEAILVCATAVSVGLYLVVDLIAAALVPDWRRRVP